MSDEHRESVLPWTSPDVPEVLTYIYPDKTPWQHLFQLQWDYQIEWPRRGRPRIKLLKYRSYQKNPEMRDCRTG